MDKCPVCGEEFGNPGALGTHLSLTKDAPHVASRAQAEGAQAGEAGAPGEAPAVPASPLAESASPEATARDAASPQAGEAGETRQAGEAGGQAGKAKAGEAGDPDIVPFLLLPPIDVKPLIPAQTGGQAGGQAGEAGGRKAPNVEVPLEPIIAGACSLALNGLVLNKPRDGKLTVEMARATGFPKAVEATLRFYFPDLPLDHPLTALIASGASLGMLVITLKGSVPAPDPDPAETASTQASKAPDASTHPSAHMGQQAPPSAAPQGTGDEYWDAILKQAGAR